VARTRDTGYISAYPVITAYTNTALQVTALVVGGGGGGGSGVFTPLAHGGGGGGGGHFYGEYPTLL
jgi:hypothetical protein